MIALPNSLGMAIAPHLLKHQGAIVSSQLLIERSRFVLEGKGVFASKGVCNWEKRVCVLRTGSAIA